MLDDSLLFRLSRNHFAIEAQGEKIVRDLDSALGTTVNGLGIGTHFSSDIAPLNVGDNTVFTSGLNFTENRRIQFLGFADAC
jgi:pSer/pThr/pTyr-binding forkhead associated (FHA) protein